MEILGSVEKILVFLFVLGVVIVFHELGHFVFAKLLDVKVEVFAFGFGRRLFGVRRGETDYRVSLIPLGGYVRMAGEASIDPDEPPRERGPRDFEAKGLPAKLAIMGAGPAFNVILAILLLAAAYLLGIEVPEYLSEPARVGIVEAGSPAERAGIRPGDRIVAVGDRPIATWEILLEAVVVSPGAETVVEVERDGETLRLPVRIETRTKHAIGWLGVTPCSRIQVGAVTRGSPADEAGLLTGDELVQVGGMAPCSGPRLVRIVQEAEGAPLEVVALRSGEQIRVGVAARRKAADQPWLMGIAPREATVVRRFGMRRALVESVATNWRQAGLLVETVGKLFTGRLSMRAMSGPLEIADVSKEAADTGLVPLLTLMALISLNLGIFNLVPIPILDGGRIFILLVEAIRGREIERRAKEWILLAGLAMILAILAVVIWFDVVKKGEG